MSLKLNNGGRYQMFTYRVWYSNILRTLDFLSDDELCIKSWILGIGPASSGWKELFNDLGGDAFFDLFPDEIDSFCVSISLKEKLLEICRKIYKFKERLPKKTSDEEFLKNYEWLILIQEIKPIVAQMKTELNNMPESSPLVYSYKSAFTSLIRHLDFLSNTIVCKASWFHDAMPFSLGLEMEIAIITSSPFFFDRKCEYLNQLKLSEEVKQHFIVTIASLKNFFSTYQYKLTSEELLSNSEWCLLAEDLRILVIKLKAELDTIPVNIFFDFTVAGSIKET